MPTSPSVNKRSTKANQGVLEALQHLSHASAQEIYEWLNRQQKTKGLSLTSIYRALNALATTSQVKQLHFNDGQSRYELNNHKSHHHHFVCLQCNAIEVIDACPIETFVQTLKSTYNVQYHTFELFGLCRACTSSEQAPEG